MFTLIFLASIDIIFYCFQLHSIIAFEHIFSPQFWSFMLVAGFFGFTMGYVVGLQIKVTTPVTHTVSGVAKACLQTVIAVLYYHEVSTFVYQSQWFSTWRLQFLLESFGYSLGVAEARLFLGKSIVEIRDKFQVRIFFVKNTTFIWNRFKVRNFFLEITRFCNKN